MPGGGEGRESHAMTYCVVPRDLAAKLHEPLRSHFAGDRWIEVIVERRVSERRADQERRDTPAARAGGRRRIRNEGGRRVGPRRAPLVAVDAPPLPRKARAHAHRLVFVERVEPSEEHLADLDSARLVTRFQAGDENAFAALYMRYFDRLYTYLAVVFRDDPHEAEDMTQQVFAAAFEALPRYERRRQPFRAWLFTIARNQAVSRRRQIERVSVVEPTILAERRESEAADELKLTLSWLTDRELVMFVERLPLAQRQVLVLKYLLDLPAKEIASILGRSPDDVRMLEHRAVRFLEARLGAIGRSAERDRSEPAQRRMGWMHVSRKRKWALYRDPRRAAIR